MQQHKAAATLRLARVRNAQSTLQTVLQQLAASQQAFLRAADSIATLNWQRPPSIQCWSGAQVVAHCCLVERGVLGYADRVIRKPPLPAPWLKRLHLPIALAESRILLRKAPQMTLPDMAMLAEKETMLAELRGVRERTLAFLEETHQRDLSMYRWRHPFLGNLNFYDWFTFLSAHQGRHTKQLLEITKNLPKGVASSQK